MPNGRVALAATTMLLVILSASFGHAEVGAHSDFYAAGEPVAGKPAERGVELVLFDDAYEQYSLH